MINKIDGIILSKTPFQERHAICHVLRRNGKKISVLFYGGLGGGKKKISSILDIGTALTLELQRSRATNCLYKAREWAPLWRYEHMRKYYWALTHLCFYLEFLDKVAVSDNLSEEDKECQNTGGLFSIASNAIVFLEKKCAHKNFDPYFSSTLFLSKLLVVEGLFPEINRCIVTEEEITPSTPSLLLHDLGGFAMVHALGRNHPSSYSNKTHFMLRSFLQKSSVAQYQDMVDSAILNQSCFNLLLEYALYQFHFTKNQFRTLKYLLN